MSRYVYFILGGAWLIVGTGLDPMRYRMSIAGDERTFSALDSQITDSERFRDATPFLVRCRHCQVRMPFLPINDPEV